VADVMTKDALSVHSDMPLWEAATLIDRHGFRRLPVVDPDGFVVGILTRSDIVRAMAAEGGERDRRDKEPTASGMARA
jgi:CBS domain-containing protein